MTPIDFGLYIFVGVFAFISPLFILYLMKTVSEYIQYFCEFNRGRYMRFMNPKYWFLREITKCPNPDYIRLRYENSESREIIELGIEKKDIREMLNNDSR